MIIAVVVMLKEILSEGKAYLFLLIFKMKLGLDNPDN